ncbi:MAG: hypothetical protein O2901_06155 [Verrucomicrobia bacterium]|nr:hypothetical protein [Verrucomicrobiota bacterium]
MKSAFVRLVSPLVLSGALMAGTASANSLAITNLSLTGVSNGMASLQFDMSWSNSWRTSWNDNGDTVTVTNWDAVWIFAKFRQSGGLWRHAMLSSNGHVATGGAVLDVADDSGTRLGAMVYRPSEGSGAMNCNAMSLRWDFATSGLSGTNEVDVEVLGVEMVYIPEGGFYLGSGGTEINHFYRYPDSTQPFLVSNEDAIAVGSVTGSLYYAGSGDLGPIPAAFPKGYQAIYCMKYEMTQGQYADFLNLLDPTIANTYYPNVYGSSRHTILLSNIVEFVVAVSRAEGRMFTDQYGDGNEYTARPSTWYPHPGARAYTGRGGGFSHISAVYQTRTSDRSSVDANNPFASNGPSYSCRGVRSAP